MSYLCLSFSYSAHIGSHSGVAYPMKCPAIVQLIYLQLVLRSGVTFAFMIQCCPIQTASLWEIPMTGEVILAYCSTFKSNASKKRNTNENNEGKSCTCLFPHTQNIIKWNENSHAMLWLSTLRICSSSLHAMLIIVEDGIIWTVATIKPRYCLQERMGPVVMETRAALCVTYFMGWSKCVTSLVTGGPDDIFLG